jgi:hypothetical protein
MSSYLYLAGNFPRATIDDEYLNEINLCEGFVISWFLNIQDRDDILVVEVTQELHFSQSPQAKHGMIKRRDFLDSHFLTRGFVQS